jgi:nitric oxide dioxygenase
MGCTASSKVDVPSGEGIAATDVQHAGKKSSLFNKRKDAERTKIVEAFYPSFHVKNPTINEELIKTVKTHWQAIAEGSLPSFEEYKKDAFNKDPSPAVLFYDTFYDRLFAIAPDTRMLFKGGISRQGPALFAMIKGAVSLLVENDINKLSTVLTELAARHNSYGAKPVHYELVGRSLVWTLQKLTEDAPLGQYDGAVAAWVKVYSFMMQVMMGVVVDHHLITTQEIQ